MEHSLLSWRHATERGRIRIITINIRRAVLGLVQVLAAAADAVRVELGGGALAGGRGQALAHTTLLLLLWQVLVGIDAVALLDRLRVGLLELVAYALIEHLERVALGDTGAQDTLELLARLLRVLVQVLVGLGLQVIGEEHVLLVEAVLAVGRRLWEGLRELVIGDLLAGLDVLGDLVAGAASVSVAGRAARAATVVAIARLLLLDGLDTHGHRAVTLDHDRSLLNGHRTVDEHWPRHVDDLRADDDALAWHKHRSNDGHVDVARYVDGLLRLARAALRHQKDRLHGLLATAVQLQVAQLISIKIEKKNRFLIFQMLEQPTEGKKGKLARILTEWS
jgi:hypothetical protein